MLRVQAIAISALLVLVVIGCGGGARDEASATPSGKVTHQGTAVPEGSRVGFVNSEKGIDMRFDVGADGAYSIPAAAEFPAGSYTVVVVPKGDDGGAADYDAAMSGAGDGGGAGKTDDFPVPEKFRDPKTSDKKVDIAAGASTVDIDFGG